MKTPRTEATVRPWSRFADGVLATLIGHGLLIVYGAFTVGLEIAVPWCWLMLGVLQVFYVVPLMLAFAITGRVGALLGTVVLAAGTAAPLFLIQLTGGMKVFPF